MKKGLIERLGLWTLEERRNRADLLEVFKLCKGLSLTISHVFHCQQYHEHSGSYCQDRKEPLSSGPAPFLFSQRVIHRWNGLQQEVINSTSVNVFQNGLKKTRITKIERNTNSYKRNNNFSFNVPYGPRTYIRISQ